MIQKALLSNIRSKGLSTNTTGKRKDSNTEKDHNPKEMSDVVVERVKKVFFRLLLIVFRMNFAQKLRISLGHV